MDEVEWGSLRPILQDLADRVARIEQFLAASGLQPPASFYPPQGPSVGQLAAAAYGIDAAGDPSSQGSQVPDHIVQMARSGKSIQAIKELRKVTGISLKEAKIAIDRISRS